MARSRNIKPGFFLNDQLAELPPLVRLLFAGLWTIADREGRLEYRPKKIKAQVLPYEDCDVVPFLDRLCPDFIRIYRVKNETFIQVNNWHKHQHPHKNETQSVIPPVDMATSDFIETSTVQVPEDSGTNPPLTLNPKPSYLIPDPLNPQLGTKSSWEDFGDELYHLSGYTGDSDTFYKIAYLCENGGVIKREWALDAARGAKKTEGVKDPAGYFFSIVEDHLKKNDGPPIRPLVVSCKGPFPKHPRKSKPADAAAGLAAEGMKKA